jgi:hypothetical protein
MLGIFPDEVRCTVGKYSGRPDSANHSSMPAHVCRQAGMTRFSKRLRPHLLAYGEDRKRIDDAKRTGATSLVLGLGYHDVRGLLHGLSAKASRPGIDGIARKDTAIDAEKLSATEPPAVVAVPEVVEWVEPLKTMTERVKIGARHTHRRQTERECTSVPFFSEYRLRGVNFDGSPALHSAHVMDSVHAVPSNLLD